MRKNMKVEYHGNPATYVAAEGLRVLIKRPFIGGDGSKRFYIQEVPRLSVRRKGRFI